MASDTPWAHSVDVTLTKGGWAAWLSRYACTVIPEVGAWPHVCEGRGPASLASDVASGPSSLATDIASGLASEVALASGAASLASGEELSTRASVGASTAPVSAAESRASEAPVSLGLASRVLTSVWPASVALSAVVLSVAAPSASPESEPPPGTR